MEMSKLLSTPEAAPLVGVAPKTLENWRVAGLGPKHLRVGRLVRYDLVDIERWKAGRRVGSTSEQIPSVTDETKPEAP